MSSIGRRMRRRIIDVCGFWVVVVWVELNDFVRATTVEGGVGEAFIMALHYHTPHLKALMV